MQKASIHNCTNLLFSLIYMITAFTQGLSVYPQESVEKIISHKIYSYIIMYSPKIYDYFLRVPTYSKYLTKQTRL